MKSFVAESVRREGTTFGTKLLMGIGIALGLSGVFLPGGIAFALMGTGFTLAFWVGSLRARAPRGRTQVIADEDKLTMGNDERSLSFSVRDFATGYAHACRVVLETHDGERLLIGFRTQEECEELLSCVGLTQEKRTLTLPLRGTVGGFTLVFVAVTLGPLLGTILKNLIAPNNTALGWMLVLAPMVALLLLFFRHRNPRVVTGADGLRIQSGRTRYVPYAAMERVDRSRDPSGSTIVVWLRAGKALTLPVIGQTEEQIAILVRRIEAGIAGVGEDGPDLSALDRGGRDLAGWRTALAELAKPAQDFRTRRVALEDLERVLGDPRAPAERRVGAAIALGAVDPQRAKDRVRVAAGAAANQKVRVALDAVAEGALEEAHLAEIDEDDAAAHEIISKPRALS